MIMQITQQMQVRITTAITSSFADLLHAQAMLLNSTVITRIICFFLPMSLYSKTTYSKRNMIGIVTSFNISLNYKSTRIKKSVSSMIVYHADEVQTALYTDTDYDAHAWSAQVPSSMMFHSLSAYKPELALPQQQKDRSIHALCPNPNHNPSVFMPMVKTCALLCIQKHLINMLEINFPPMDKDNTWSLKIK